MRSTSIRSRIAGALVAVAIATGVTVVPTVSATAYTAADFDPGYIISDAAFFNSGSMGEPQVQAFLQAALPGCAAANGQPCLKNYTESTASRPPSPSGQCGAYPGAASEPASRIIVKVAQACGINPQVLLATLQKERGLVTKSSPVAADYRVAMGYGCPDTAACDTQYYGFSNQVFRAAQQFKTYTLFPGSFRYRVGTTAVQLHPNAGCGAPVINIRNQATANLYNYTPYQPNAAAMANLRGTGDGCSSYGNRNFWVYYNDWFGSPTGRVNPLGSFDVAAAGVASVRVAGWAFDPDTKNSIGIHVYVNGVGTAFVADGLRNDLTSAFGDVGTAHGYDVAVPVSGGGIQQACVYAINEGPGTNVLLGCRSVNVLIGPPIGVVDVAAAGPGTVTVAGWVFDPDTAASIPVHVYVDGVGVAAVASGSRPDVGSAYPAYGSAHGYSVTVPAAAGIHTVCVYGINQSLGTNSELGCRQVGVPGGSPVGVVDSVSVAPGTISVSGWAFDPDTAASIPVHVYSDASGLAFTANKPRSDVASTYPGYGQDHGYTETFAATPGVHNVCVYGIETAGIGANRGIGCRVVTAMSGPPVAVVDAISVLNGRIDVSGWAYDPDSVSPVTVRVDIDGAVTSVSAAIPRPDFASTYPAYGSSHGYGATLPISSGQHRVCVSAVNVAAGADSVPICRMIVA